MRKAVPIVLFALGLLLLWFLRTWFHPLLLFFYATPVILQALVLTLIIHFAILRNIPALQSSTMVQVTESQQTDYRPIEVVIPLVFLLLLIPGLFLAHFARGVTLAEQTNYVTIDGLPESLHNLRVMPYEVAARYAKDSLQLSQYKLGTENLALVGDNLSWVFPLTPDGTLITFLRQNKGVVIVDATDQEKNSRQVWRDFSIGEGMQVTDNLFWNLLRKRYVVKLDRPYYLPQDDEIYTVVGAVGFKWGFRMGVFYTWPYFHGVFLVDTKGNVELLSPEEAASHPVLRGNRIFPENLARIQVNAHQYQLGVINKLFIHEDQIQIQDVKNASSKVNLQPYLMDTSEGLKWFISTEPHGASHGIFKIFLVDATTGKVEMYELPQQETLTGPVRSGDYVRRSNPVVDWSRFNAVEPLPFVRDGKLYWKLTIIPEDAAGIAYQAFVNAETNEVVELQTMPEIKAFLQGQEVLSVQRNEEIDVVSLIREKIREIEDLLRALE